MAFELQLRGIDDFKMDSHKQIRWGMGEKHLGILEICMIYNMVKIQQL